MKERTKGPFWILASRRLGTVLPVLTLLCLVTARAQHESEILDVKVGMDVPTALETVFKNAHRKAGQEKPDALIHEGKDKKDIRVLYRNLEIGNMQIVFAEGKWVKEIVVEYAKPLRYEDLHLPESSNTFANSSGVRYDDRYSVGYTSDKKTERYWWRDEQSPGGYRVRVGFVSGKLTNGSIASKEIVRKIITVVAEDNEKFEKVMMSTMTKQ